ncbi:MAG: ferrochelatase [Nitrospirota bacterium]
MEGTNNAMPRHRHASANEIRNAHRSDVTADSGNITGVILLNLGGPDSLRAVKPFLFNLFSDRQIIRLGPSFMQIPLAWLISTIRSYKTRELYRMIGGKSPILSITTGQAEALEKSLNQPAFSDQHSPSPAHTFRVYTGMRYWHPFIEDVVSLMYKDGIRRIIALSLYPQYSVTTSGSSISRFTQVVSGYQTEYSCISSWHEHPLYIQALAEVIEKGIQSFTKDAGSDGDVSRDTVHVLFSAHSLPQKIIDEGDPYQYQTEETIRKITELIPLQWHLSYQSKSGPVKWLEPFTDAKLEELASKGIKNILIVPISFVSDHIETLYEIDILFKKHSLKLGINLKRADSLNVHPVFINALRELVMQSMRESGW